GNITYKTFNSQLNIDNETLFTEAISDEIDASVILALGDELIQTYCSESGLPEGRATGERGRTVGQLKAFANLLLEGSWVEATIDTAQSNRQPLPKSDLRKLLIPLGPVVVFGASNFPLAFSTAGGDTASALAAGCPVIVKSHPMHSGTGALVASAIIKAAEETGMPNGVFSNLNSSGIEVGQQLVQHPKVKAVGFTGSFKGGKALFDLAAQRDEPIPVFAEMGSVNPVVLLPEALKNRGEALAKTYAGSITLGTGQFCTNPGLLVGIKSESLSSFIQNLSEEILKIEPTCMLHPNIHDTYNRNKKRALSQNGIKVQADYSSDTKPNYAKQAVTTVEGKTFLENPTLHQEVFGPYSIVVQCQDEEQLEEIISKLEGQLTGTVMAEADEIIKYPEVIAALQNRVGRIIFNGVPTGVEVCPSMMHGGPFPASTDSRFTSVGVDAIKRWVRPFSFQDWPNDLLPEELKDDNPLGIFRTIDGLQTKNNI
ncbi:MAG: aldehyde dehydrogenase (NADP(+)), partial [Aquaticitalea sp.]